MPFRFLRASLYWVSLRRIQGDINHNDNNVSSYIAHITSQWRLMRSIHKSIEGINSCQVPIYYTWVERDNCGQNALSRGIHIEWDLNPRPSDYKSRTQTNTPPCSHLSSGSSIFVSSKRKNSNIIIKIIYITPGK